MAAAFTPYLAGRMGVEESDVSFDHETFRAPRRGRAPSPPGRDRPAPDPDAGFVMRFGARSGRRGGYTKSGGFGILGSPVSTEGQGNSGRARRGARIDPAGDAGRGWMPDHADVWGGDLARRRGRTHDSCNLGAGIAAAVAARDGVRGRDVSTGCNGRLVLHVPKGLKAEKWYCRG
ncbi:hypothetical protein FGK63_09845 [Ruegeria sediminis]|uniref:Uncharacterized protein n=1 Tax=Ruegeria sediminis TaxID=2583820 RepID=A0ABY2WZ05_9RHOB|nr:hypothetical protein FGK63_09845 [Ruegeria sediminis]